MHAWLGYLANVLAGWSAFYLFGLYPLEVTLGGGITVGHCYSPAIPYRLVLWTSFHLNLSQSLFSKVLYLVRDLRLVLSESRLHRDSIIISMLIRECGARDIRL